MPETLLYLLINLAAVSVPLLLSFDGKVRFWKSWPFVLPAIAITATGFILWDIGFTARGIWGFNPRYLTGIEIANLPLAEVLFFFTVPYACIFIYATLLAYWPRAVGRFPWQAALAGVSVLALVLLAANPTKPYTLSAALLALALAGWIWRTRPGYAAPLMATYIVTLLPFFLMNGILTGTWIPEEIVWYSATGFSGWRAGTIPLEDFLYSFDLLALNVVLLERFRR